MLSEVERKVLEVIAERRPRSEQELFEAYLEEKGVRRERVTLYLKGEPVLTVEASVRVLTDAFGRRYEVYESPLLEELPDGVYTLQDGRKGRKKTNILLTALCY